MSLNDSNHDGVVRIFVAIPCELWGSLHYITQHKFSPHMSAHKSLAVPILCLSSLRGPWARSTRHVENMPYIKHCVHFSDQISVEFVPATVLNVMFVSKNTPSSSQRKERLRRRKERESTSHAPEMAVNHSNCCNVCCVIVTVCILSHKKNQLYPQGC